MSVAPHAGIIDFGTFTPPTDTRDGIQGEVPKPLIGQQNYVLTESGWAPASGGGGVSSVTGTAPIVSSGGATPVISIPQATNAVNGYLSATDWTTFNNKGNGTVTSVGGTGAVNGITLSGTVTASGNLTLGGTLSGIGNSQLTNSSITINGSPISLGGSVTTPSGTVTSVAALTLGTTGTDLSSTVATGTTTPVITLQVPTASATNRGALSAADWTTFNNKTSNTGTVTNVAATAGTGISITGSPITTSGTLNITNTAPDQTVVLTAGTGINTSGTYPNFTITNSLPDQIVSLTAGSNITVTGTYPSFTIASSGGGGMTYPTGTGIAVVTGGTSWGTTLTAPTGAIVGTTDTQTLTNKRVTPRVSTVASSATPTIDTDNTDQFGLTAQAVDITSFTANLSGTPTDGQKLWIYIVGTAARAITWGASFEASTATLPTTTVSTNRLDVGFVWNTATSKWRCVAVA